MRAAIGASAATPQAMRIAHVDFSEQVFVGGVAMMVEVNGHSFAALEDIAVGASLHRQVMHIGGGEIESGKQTLLGLPGGPEGMMARIAFVAFGRTGRKTLNAAKAAAVQNHTYVGIDDLHIAHP